MAKSEFVSSTLCNDVGGAIHKPFYNDIKAFSANSWRDGGGTHFCGCGFPTECRYTETETTVDPRKNARDRWKPNKKTDTIAVRGIATDVQYTCMFALRHTWLGNQIHYGVNYTDRGVV